jgi:acyl-coenzyme A thioesterase PaaI-like protein
MSSTQSLQEEFAPEGRCFGCGPKNEKGLRIRSFPAEGSADVVCDFTPQPHHEAFPGVINGGIIGALLDCHCNWTAAWFFRQRDGVAAPPCTVTAEYTIKLTAPTPSAGPIHMTARVIASTRSSATVEGELSANGTVTATCSGKFVWVKPDHPAFHRW